MMQHQDTRTRMLIAVDDTDSPEHGGTGRVARELAQLLAGRAPVHGVTRHQLAVLPAINYTRNNSANVVHLLDVVPEPGRLADELAEWLRRVAQPEAAPGLCIAQPEALQNEALGPAAQRRVVTTDEVRDAAAANGILLRHCRTGDGGIVGAYAGACLAAGADDGRFILIGSLRALAGHLTPEDIIAAGADDVRTVDGNQLRGVTIIAERLRPAFQRGRCILYCTPGPDGSWTPVKGRPENNAGR